MKRLQLPLSEAAVRSLETGDFVLLTGLIHTGRDAVHKFLHDDGTPPPSLRGGVIYHCGPVVVDTGGNWQVTAAGPTTSIREEPYMADLIAALQLRGIIGKGGMGTSTLDACARCGCAYFHSVGGAAQVLAARITAVEAVDYLDRFGVPEAIWHLRVVDFPVVVTMDTHGRSLHRDVENHARRVGRMLAAETVTDADSPRTTGRR